MEKSLTDSLHDLRTGLEQYLDHKFESQVGPIKSTVSKVVEAQDQMIADGQKIDLSRSKDQSLIGQISGLISSNLESIKGVANGTQQKARFETKALPMLTSTHITGGGVNTYNTRIGVTPGDLVNVRDLIPSVRSETALWVNYTETVTGAPATQTEGANKAPIEYAYTATTLTAQYIAGYTKFSKQLAAHLPFLRDTLVTSLLRDFYKVENTILITQLINQATGYDSSAETADVKALIDVLAGRLDAGYANSFIAVSFAQYGGLLKSLYDNSNYLGAGSIVGTPGGGVSVWSTPVTPVSWLADDKALIVDNSYVQRVVVDPLKIEFSEHDGDNFQKNLISARIEEMEVISVLKGDAVSYFDFGGES